MAQEPDPYKVLGVPMTADSAMVDAAFRTRIFAAHPDRDGSDAEAARVLWAAKILRTPARRARYDRDQRASDRGHQPFESQDEASSRLFSRERGPADNRPIDGAPHDAAASAASSRSVYGSSSRSKLVSFMQFSLLGQWATACAVFISLALIVPILDRAPPGSMTDSTVWNLTIVWLLVGAVLSHSWTRNPLGQTIRFSWRILVRALDLMDGARK